MLGRNFIRRQQQLLHGDHDPSRLVSALLLCVLLGVLVNYIKRWGIFDTAQQVRGKRSKRAREFSRFVNEHVDLSAGGMAPHVFHVSEDDTSPPAKK